MRNGLSALASPEQRERDLSHLHATLSAFHRSAKLRSQIDDNFLQALRAKLLLEQDQGNNADSFLLL